MPLHQARRARLRRARRSDRHQDSGDLEQRLLVATGSGGVREARCRAFTVPRGTTTPTPRLVLSAVDIGRIREPLSTGVVLARHQNDQANTFIVSLRLHHGQGAAILRRSGNRRRASGRNESEEPSRADGASPSSIRAGTGSAYRAQPRQHAGSGGATRENADPPPAVGPLTGARMPIG